MSSCNIGPDWSPIVIICRWFRLSHNRPRWGVLPMYRSSSSQYRNNLYRFTSNVGFLLPDKSSIQQYAHHFANLAQNLPISPIFPLMPWPGWTKFCVWMPILLAYSRIPPLSALHKYSYTYPSPPLAVALCMTSSSYLDYKQRSF